MDNISKYTSFNHLIFNKNIQADFEEARKVFVRLSDYEYYKMSSDDTEFEGDIDLDNEQLKYYFNQIKLKLIYAFELFELKILLNELILQFNDYKDNLTIMHYESEYDYFYSPVNTLLKNYYDVFISSFDIEGIQSSVDQKQFLLLEQILRGTPKILTDRGIVPSKEVEVKQVVYDLLIHVFPDTVREIPIAKVSKCYKPDIGIKRLKCAIEYKFVDSKEEAKTSIGGIFEDILGYNGSADWTNFYAIIYMTDNYLTQYQIDEEFKLSKVDTSWKPIVIYGKGNRKNYKK